MGHDCEWQVVVNLGSVQLVLCMQMWVLGELQLSMRKRSTKPNGHLQWLSASQTLTAPSHCVTAVVHCCFSLVERLSYCMILLPDTVWHCGQTFYLFPFLFSFLKKNVNVLLESAIVLSYCL